MLSCLFGHKIVDNKCVKCKKEICECLGHEWIFSDIQKLFYTNNNGEQKGLAKMQPFKRRCKICNRKEIYLHSNEGDAEWVEYE